MADNQCSKISQTPNSVPRPDPDPEKDIPPDSRPTGYSLDYQEQKIINNSAISKTTPFDPKSLVLNPNNAVEFLHELKTQHTSAIPQSSTNRAPSTDTHRTNHKSQDKTTPTTNRTNSRVAISQSGNIVNGNCQGPLINGNVQAPVLTGGQHTTQNFYQPTPKEKDVESAQKERDDAFERRHRFDKKKKRHVDGRDEDSTNSSEKHDGRDSSDDSSSTF